MPEVVTNVEVLPTDSLVPREAKRLEVLGCKIDRELKICVEVGEALSEINANLLYRATYKTFAEYCEERWGIGRDYGYKLMKAANVVGVLSTAVDSPVPRNEATARPLTALLDQPDEMKKAWDEACAGAKSAGREPSAEDVINSETWKTQREAKIGHPQKSKAKPPEKSQEATISEAMKVVVEVPSIIAKVTLEKPPRASAKPS